MAKNGTATSIGEPTNGAQEAIETGLPYIVNVTIEGSADLLLHAWNCEAIQEKADSKKKKKARPQRNRTTWKATSDAMTTVLYVCRVSTSA